MKRIPSRISRSHSPFSIHEATMSDKATNSSESAAPSAAPQLPPVDPRLLAAMYGLAREDEIDLLEYWGIIKKRKKVILYVMLAAAIISAGISLLMPNVYKAQVLMAPVNSDLTSSGSGSGLAARLGGSGLGSLASLAGISLGSSNSAEQNLAVLQMRAFLWDFIKDNKLMPILFADDWDAKKKAWEESDPKDQPNLWDAYRYFTKGEFPVGSLLSVSTDKDSGLVTVAVNWTNPVLAADWANKLVARLNNYLRKQAITRSEANLKYLNEAVQKTSVADVRQALFTLIAQEQKKAMIANAQKEYAFQVLDAAAPPDRKAKPHRALIVVLSVFVAGFLIMAFVLMKEGLRQRKQTEAQGPSEETKSP
ncbi:MAG: Wzz/FepE/Etk N-terminal domain-containing protein [Gammaproteobacteria bacterium]